ncbi:11057_t:CDS:2 [Paraglomus brasilianum]|uniref:11057_t:CDS:1 n=1 Tax=Paraglomus brasilianum TaxID=144538 RepID=A0A9N9EVN8_9GLOM|nr:11057_t:CDS:2 [Paraglomus brasilianum]
MSLTSLIISLSFWDALTILWSFALIYTIKFYLLYFTRENPLPGPLPLPLVGNLLQLATAGDTSRWALQCQAKYGDMWEVYIGSSKYIWVARADLTEKIMDTSKTSNYFIRTSSNSGIDMLGISSSGLAFNEDKEKWFFNRKIVAQAITNTKFIKQITEWIQQEFVEMEGYLMELGFDEKAFNCSDWIRRLVTDTIFVASMNKYACTLASLYNSHNPSKPAPYSRETVAESDNFVHALRTYFSTLDFFLFMPDLIRTKTPFGRRQTKIYMNNLYWLHEALMKIIKGKKEEIKNEQSELRPDLLTLLATVNTPRDMTQKIKSTVEGPLTVEEIRTCLLDLLVAGIDTNPEVKKRLQNELDTIYGADPIRPITHEDLNKFVYIEAVIKETSRILPATALNIRTAERDDTIGGYPIKGGQQIIVSFAGIQHHPKHWPNPKQFNPDRFLEPNASKIEKHALPMFGGGLRICPGRHMAMAELKVVIAMIFRKYDLELATADTELKFKCDLVNHCSELMLRFKPRTKKAVH